MRSPDLTVLTALVILGATPAAGQDLAADAKPVREVGVGVVQPPLDPGRPLYLYGAPRPGIGPEAAIPIDSVVFATGPHHVGISSAPPWFAPEGLKLDYDLLWMRARTMTRSWLEIEVNTIDPRPRFVPATAWVSRESVSFRPWPEFLLEVFSVETLDPAHNPLRLAPDDDADVAHASSGLPLRPLLVRGDWLQVEAVDGSEVDRPVGWIRWRGDGMLLVSFSLLS